MSLKDNLPRRAFSLLYLATQELEVSLSSATAVAMLGSVLSMLIVFLTFWITSWVSFVYSSSEAANAAGITSSGEEMDITAANDKKFRRWVVAVVVVVVEEEGGESLERMGGRSLGVEVVGVIKVGDAMAVAEERWRELLASSNRGMVIG